MIKRVVFALIIVVSTAALASGTSFTQDYVCNNCAPMDTLEVFLRWSPDNNASQFTQPIIISNQPLWTSKYVNVRDTVATGPDTNALDFHLVFESPEPVYLDIFGLHDSQVVTYASFLGANNYLTGWDLADSPDQQPSMNWLYQNDKTLTADARSAVPEPATMGLMGASLLGLGAFGFRRRSR